MNNRTKLWLALTMVGITGGLVGIVLTELLHFVQHHAYGYALDADISRSAKAWMRPPRCGGFTRCSRAALPRAAAGGC